MRCMRNRSSYPVAEHSVGSHFKRGTSTKYKLFDTKQLQWGYRTRNTGHTYPDWVNKPNRNPSRNSLRRIPCRVRKQQVRNCNAFNQRYINRVSIHHRWHNSLRRHSHSSNRDLLGDCRIHCTFLHIDSNCGSNNRRIPKLVPNSVREASLALGAHKWRTTLSVVLPSAKAGLLTGTLLAVARIAGETAPLIMTILGNRYFFQGLNQPMAALPLEIWRDSLQPQASLQAQGWGAALILILMVLSLNIIVRLASRGKLRR